jgi:hypothetical protein
MIRAARTRRGGLPRLSATLVVAIAAGCAYASTPLVGTPLPTAAFQPPPSETLVCAGIGLDAILHGDPADPALTWVIDRTAGIRMDAIWPAGFSARFEPALQVLDAAGEIVHREGDIIDGGCVAAVQGEILLGYP